jgi:hypothetical protein
MPKTPEPKARLRLELNTIEADVSFDDIKLAANTDQHLVIVLTNQAGERVSVLLAKKTLKEIAGWTTLLSL